jgi:uncharacterized protein
MKTLRLGPLLIATLAAGVVRAAPASPESVERLMQAMQVQAQVETTTNAQVLPAMQAAVRQILATQLKSDEAAARMFNAVRPRVDAVLLEQLSWARLKPGFAQIYAETFSEEEVKGLIAFYEGPVGSALISKTPQLLQRSAQLLQQRMGPLLQQVTLVTKEEIEKARAGPGIRN